MRLPLLLMNAITITIDELITIDILELIDIVEFIAMSRLSRDTHTLYKGQPPSTYCLSCSRTVNVEGCVALTSLLLILLLVLIFIVYC